MYVPSLNERARRRGLQVEEVREGVFVTRYPEEDREAARERPSRDSDSHEDEDSDRSERRDED